MKSREGVTTRVIIHGDTRKPNSEGTTDNQTTHSASTHNETIFGPISPSEKWERSSMNVKVSSVNKVVSRSWWVPAIEGVSEWAIVNEWSFVYKLVHNYLHSHLCISSSRGCVEHWKSIEYESHFFVRKSRVQGHKPNGWQNNKCSTTVMIQTPRYDQTMVGEELEE